MLQRPASKNKFVNHLSFSQVITKAFLRTESAQYAGTVVCTRLFVKSLKKSYYPLHKAPKFRGTSLNFECKDRLVM